RARALERLGRADEARTELERVLEQDRAGTRWYALWAQQRLLALGAAATPAAAPVAQLEGKGTERATEPVGAALDPERDGQPPIVLLGSASDGAPAPTPRRPADVPNVTATPEAD